MKYDFTSIIDRRGKDSLAVDIPEDSDPFQDGTVLKEGFDKIPMWVADMNFATAPMIPQTIAKRLEHPFFGYFSPSDEYLESIINWQKTQNHVEGLEKEHIGYENGVLGGVVSALKVFGSRGEKILVHAPTYVGFTSALTNSGFNIVHSYLKKDEDGIWRMDYEDMDRKIKKHKIHAAIFCSPHNPCGRVWEKWEIEKAMEVYAANDVYVVSDEIWSDITLYGHQHIPTQSVSEDARNRTIAMYAPTKTFNLAGLVGSYHIIYNKYLRERMEKESSTSHYNMMNVLSMHALIGAYSEEGREWMNEMRQVIGENVDYACNFIWKNWEGVKVSRPQGTYMLFLNCEEWCKAHHKTMDEVLKAGFEVGVIWKDGRPFHGEYGIRINLALPLSKLKEAFDRLDKYVFG